MCYDFMTYDQLSLHLKNKKIYKYTLYEYHENKQKYEFVFVSSIGIESAVFRHRGGVVINNNDIGGGGGGRAGSRTVALLGSVLTSETCGRNRRPAALQQPVRWRRGQHVDKRVPDTRPPGTGVRGPQNRRDAVLVRTQGRRTIHQRRATAVSSLPSSCSVRLRPDRYPVRSRTGRRPVRSWTGCCPVRPRPGRRPVRLRTWCGCPVWSWTCLCPVRPRTGRRRVQSRPDRQYCRDSIFSLTRQFLRTARNPLFVQTMIRVIHLIFSKSLHVCVVTYL